MKTIIFDGYNVIHSSPEMKKALKQGLEAARKSLAAYLSGWRRRYAGSEVIIVFDGRDDGASGDYGFSEQRLAGIKCLFTRSHEEADDRIISLIKNSGDPRNITVVSDDNSIRNSCRAHGAGVRGTDFIMARAKNKTKAPGEPAKSPAPNMGRVTAYYREYLRGTGKI